MVLKITNNTILATNCSQGYYLEVRVLLGLLVVHLYLVDQVVPGHQGSMSIKHSNR